jgi:hypothetical protein
MAPSFRFCARGHSDSLFARHVNLLSALTSRIRHETSDAEIRHLTNLLNSDDTTTLLFGTRHAPVESVDVR